MVVDDGIVITSSQENLSSNGERIAGDTAREVLARMELDIAYSSEKVLNLEILMMQVSHIASDYEILSKGPEELLTVSIEKAFQFDILTGFLNSVVREMDSFMASLQLDIVDAHKKFTECDNHLEDFVKIEEKLHSAELSLKNSQDIVADISKQSDKFEKFLAFWISTDGDLENGEYSAMNSKWKLQTVEQQRHFLQSFEKSLAREMDLEKNLSESRYNEEKLKIKLQFTEQNACYAEEFIELLMVKMFTAENSVEFLLGNLKEFIGKLQNGQFSCSSLTTRERDGKANMEKCFIKLPSEEDDPRISRTLSFVTNSFPAISDIDLRSSLKELEDKCLAASSDVSTLRETVNILKEQLRESERQLQLVKVRESRAESVDSLYTQSLKSNVELKDELEFLKSNGTEEVDFLERKLKESNMQLEHAKASFEAIEEQRQMLCTSLTDMEHLIKDLKGRVSKAENRAESAEAKCTLLTDANLELNEELSFLRGKLENLEASLHQADMEKIAAVKDIGHRTRLIIELVKKLAFERERLQLQVLAEYSNSGVTHSLVKDRNKFKSLLIRIFPSIWMIGSFIWTIYMGHLHIWALVVIIQVLTVRELFNFHRIVYEDRRLPGFRILNWYLFFTAMLFTYGRFLSQHLVNTITTDKMLYQPVIWIVKYQLFICYSLYIAGFVWFIVTLRRGLNQYQYSQYAWTHVILLLVFAQSSFAVANLFEGIFWFLLPASLIILNDMIAYFCWFFGGRTPLIKLSPKKTFDLLICAVIITILSAFLLANVFGRFLWLTCPRKDLSTGWLSCDPGPMFKPEMYSLSRWVPLWAERANKNLARENTFDVEFR